MIRTSLRASVLLLAGILGGDVGALALAPAAPDPHEDISAAGEQAAPRVAPSPKPRVADATPAPAQSAPSGNPLWGIPLRQLSATRERPLFSPSRHLPPPPPVHQVAVAPPPPPPKPAEPERPQLSLVGTVEEEEGGGGIGVFLDAADKSVLRLKTGESNKGWTLRSVSRRSVVLVKGYAMVELAIPIPDLAKRDAPQSIPQSSLAAAFGLPAAAPAGEAGGLKGPPLPPAAAPAIAPPAPAGISSSAPGAIGAFTLPAAARH